MAHSAPQTDSFILFLCYQLVAETEDMVELCVPEVESKADSKPLTGTEDTMAAR